jgi:hypothetical protein
MMKRKSMFLLLATILIAVSCNKENKHIEITAVNLHQEIDRLSDVMVHDIFSPPVASRIFAYPNIAAYEIISLKSPQYKSLSGQLTDLKPIPKPNPEKPVNFQLAALIAHIEISKSLIFSEERIEVYRDSLYKIWKSTNEEEFEASKIYAMQVTEHIKSWINKDNYKETRTMPKFTVISDDPGRWQPTPPSYMDGIEPHWNKIRPFVLKTADQFKPIPPPEFSMVEGSQFHKELMEVYDIKQKMNKQADDSEELAIAQFWDCNPYVTVTRGHLMFATKKITPGAHWMGITKIACIKDNVDFDRAVYAYTKTSIAIADGFISSFDEKYRSNLIRPETLINKFIDDNWKPVLQTPPFPEYTSAHSVVSGAAAIALADVFGDNFSFQDDTEISYGLPIRSFNSFDEASAEAAISRMYGGIHYRSAVEVGLDQGRKLGNYVIETLEMELSKKDLATN